MLALVALYGRENPNFPAASFAARLLRESAAGVMILLKKFMMW